MDLYEALELRIAAARSLEKIILEVVWGSNKVLLFNFIMKLLKSLKYILLDHF